MEEKGKKWLESEREGVGRLLLAARDLLPGEVIVEDTALVVAPLYRSVCLSCMESLEEGVRPCHSCGWPFCRACGQEGVCGGHQRECEIFRQAGLSPQGEGSEHMFPIITILRVLLLKEEGNGEKWSKVEELMDNWEEFRKDANLVEELSQVTSFLKGKLGLRWVDERSVARAYGVMKTNAMGFKDQGGQALYPIASLMSHNCVSNLEVVGEPGRTVVFRSKRKIKEGEELTIRYAMFLQQREQIQEVLSSSYHFTCSCSRCSQESELGLHFSSLQCSCGGFFSTRLNSRSHLCSRCGNDADLSARLQKVNELSLRLAEDGATAEVEEAIDKLAGCHSTFHLRIQLYLASLANQHQMSKMQMVDRAGVVVSSLAKLEGGWSQLVAKYFRLLAMAQGALARQVGQGEAEEGSEAVLANSVKLVQRLKADLSSGPG